MPSYELIVLSFSGENAVLDDAIIDEQNRVTLMYSFSATTRVGFDDAIEQTKAALAEEGFGVLTTIDVKATMKAKLDIEQRPYTILGACNPALAHQALTADADIGLLLPCNVVVREEADSSVTIAFMDPVAVLALVDQATIDVLADQVRTKLQRVCEHLNSQS